MLKLNFFCNCLCLTTLCLAVAALCQQKPNATIRVRDITTGYAVVQATVIVRNAADGKSEILRGQTNSLGRLSMNLPSGKFLVEISAPGYKTMKDIRYDSSSGEFGTAELDRVAPPPELLPDVLKAQERKGYLFVYGFVVDADTGRPLADVEARMPKVGLNANTDARGFFSQSVLLPVPPAPDQGTLDDLSVSLPGYKTYEATNVDLPKEGWQGFQIDLHRGQGKETHDVTPTPLREPSTVPPSHGTALEKRTESRYSAPGWLLLGKLLPHLQSHSPARFA